MNGISSSLFFLHAVEVNLFFSAFSSASYSADITRCTVTNSRSWICVLALRYCFLFPFRLFSRAEVKKHTFYYSFFFLRFITVITECTWSALTRSQIHIFFVSLKTHVRVYRKIFMQIYCNFLSNDNQMSIIYLCSEYLMTKER